MRPFFLHLTQRSPILPSSIILRGSCALTPPHLWFSVSGEQRGGQVLVQDPHVVLFQSAPAGPTTKTKLQLLTFTTHPEGVQNQNMMPCTVLFKCLLVVMVVYSAVNICWVV